MAALISGPGVLLGGYLSDLIGKNDHYLRADFVCPYDHELLLLVRHDDHRLSSDCGHVLHQYYAPGL